MIITIRLEVRKKYRISRKKKKIFTRPCTSIPFSTFFISRIVVDIKFLLSIIYYIAQRTIDIPITRLLNGVSLITHSMAFIKKYLRTNFRRYATFHFHIRFDSAFRRCSSRTRMIFSSRNCPFREIIFLERDSLVFHWNTSKLFGEGK